MASSTARACLRRASDFVNSKRTVSASARVGKAMTRILSLNALHMNLCTFGKKCDSFDNSQLDISIQGAKIRPQMRKKEDRMAKSAGRGARVLKFDAAGR